MYTEYYGFKEKPFTLTPDASFLYLGRQHQQALTTLNYGIQSKAAVTVVSGEVGSGKTTLIRQVLQNMDEDITVGLISNAHRSFGDLLRWIFVAFNIESDAIDKAARYQTFVDFLIKEYSKNKRTVLIIDEAQNMDIETLEELRLLSNINADKHLVLQLILVGQPELLEILQSHELRQLAQRVSIDFKLHPFGYKETKAYIQHRLMAAGGNKELFDKYAIATVFYYSRGIPRLINTLCDFALVYGFAGDKKVINLDVMLGVVKDKQQGGIFPIIKTENKAQVRVRELVKEEKGVDIQPELTEIDEDAFFDL